MGTETTSARRKFGHALSIIYPLVEDIGEYEDSNPYRFHASIGFAADDVTRWEIEAEERRPPGEDWALRAGDAIQNLRAALDHAVWAATPEDKRTRWTQFPICDKPKDFRQASSKENERNSCAFVKDEVLAAIERAQPYERSKRKEDREHEPLRRLRELSNEDKHRTLAAVAVGVEEVFVASARETKVSFTRLTLGHPLAPGRTHVATIDVQEEGHVKSAIPSFVVKVLIAGGDMFDLEAIGHNVFRVLWECEFERQMPLWTPPWPI